MTADNEPLVQWVRRGKCVFNDLIAWGKGPKSYKVEKSSKLLLF